MMAFIFQEMGNAKPRTSRESLMYTCCASPKSFKLERFRVHLRNNGQLADSAFSSKRGTQWRVSKHVHEEKLATRGERELRLRLKSSI